MSVGEGAPGSRGTPGVVTLIQRARTPLGGRGRPSAGFGQGPGQLWLSRTPTDLFWGLKSWGKSPPAPPPPTQTPRTSQAGSSLGSRVPIPRQEAGSPQPTLRGPSSPSLLLSAGGWGDTASPPAHRGAEVGGASGSPPSPAPPSPPHLRRAAPCSAPGRPQRSTGAPPGSSPRAATRSRPARPRLRGAPSPASSRPARVGGAAQGRGRRGVPAPGADTRRHPASREASREHAGAAPRDPGSPFPRPPTQRAGRLRTRLRRRVTFYPYPGPGASGSWSLFEHKGPGATAAALPPPLLRSKPPLQDTLSGFEVQSRTPRVGCPPPLTRAAGTLRPRTSRGPRLARGLPPTPSG